MKKYWLLLFAITPIVIGYLYNYIILISFTNVINIVLSAIFIIYWFVIGYISTKFTNSKKEGLLLTNSFAIIFLVILIIQNIIVGHYLPVIGGMSQMFYLPTIKIASMLQNTILFFVTTYHMWMTCCVSFVLMILVYFAGWKAGSKNR
jgi:hypothetical protein